MLAMRRLFKADEMRKTLTAAYEPIPTSRAPHPTIPSEVERLHEGASLAIRQALACRKFSTRSKHREAADSWAPILNGGCIETSGKDIAGAGPIRAGERSTPAAGRRAHTAARSRYVRTAS